MNDYSLFDNYLDEGEIDFRSLFKRQKKFTNPLFKSKFSIERNSIYLENQMYEKSRDVWLAIKQMFGKYVCSMFINMVFRFLHGYVISRIKKQIMLPENTKLVHVSFQS